MVSTLCLSPSVPAALAASCALGTLFVACLYLYTGQDFTHRDDPVVVKKRFVRVGIVCALAPLVTLTSGLLSNDDACTPRAPWPHWIGLWSPALPLALVGGLGLTMLLFTGPLVMAWLDMDRSLTLRERILGSQRDPRARLLVVRNLVVGPLAEEWVFRACMCPLLFGAGFSDAANVFTSALIFGAAHIHHRFDGGAVNWMAVAVQARARLVHRPRVHRPPVLRPLPPCADRTLCLLPAVYVHVALWRLLLVPVPAHGADRGAARRVRRRCQKTRPRPRDSAAPTSTSRPWRP
jgi:hypothetical protein